MLWLWPFLGNFIWVASWQSQQNGMCAQRKLRTAWASAQSDQSLRCPHEESLFPQLPIEHTANALIRLGGCPGWSEASLGIHAFCWFCHEVDPFLFGLWLCPFLGYFIRATSGQNQHNVMCTERRLRSVWASAQSDQTLRCALNGYLKTQAFFMRTAKTDQTGRTPRLIWVFTGQFHMQFCSFCHEMVQLYMFKV